METLSFQDTVLYQFAIFNQFRQIRHAITCRIGGCTNYGFNIALHHGDPEKAKQHREEICQYLEVPAQHLVVPQQVHSNRVTVVGKENQGSGVATHESAIVGVDAIITQQLQTPLLAFSADCPLIGFYAVDRQVIAVAHASWRSTVGEIAKSTVLHMQREFAVAPRNIYACISPAIGPCCYEIGEDVAQQVRQLPAGEKFLAAKNARYHFDLWHANRHQLRSCGVENIVCAEICTYCQYKRFFSYRREGMHTGRFGFFLTLIT